MTNKKEEFKVSGEEIVEKIKEIIKEGNARNLLGGEVILKKFKYLKPDSIKETISILSQYGKKAQILNGGTDLIVEMRDKIIQPEYVVDIKAIPQLNKITYNKQDGLNIGATVTLNEISNSKVVQTHYPILVKACKTVGSYQVRNRATLAGNICNASPAADTAPPLLVLEAKVNIIGPTGEKIVPINQFFTGVKKNILNILAWG
ncbi:unnamed protein product [marine sediment metagenome]|uniref:FAD-binding PCMH-type domain-containing protein n=1 Tax=marine sediment metagenome TaxID=412755 RepID=X1J7D2_9ZZZZ